MSENPEFTLTTFRTAAEGPSFHTLVLEHQETGYICVPVAARSEGLLLAMPGDQFPEQFLVWDREAEQGTTGPCSAEEVRATLPYTRDSVLQDSSLHIYLLDVGLVTINSLAQYNDAMEPQEGLVFFTDQDRIVLPYWQDLKDSVARFVAAYSASHPGA